MSHSIEEEEVQDKGIEKIFNKIIAETFPNLKKEMEIQVQEAFRTQNRNNQKITTPDIRCIFIVKIPTI
jgi:hypothetical protein